MTVSTFAINNLTVTQNHGNTTITAENMFRGGTHSTYVAQVLAIGKGVYTFVECQFDNEQTDAAYDGKPVHGTFATLQAAAQAAFDFIVEMVTKLENDFAAGYPANKVVNEAKNTIAKKYNYSKNNLACLAIKAFADAANQVLHIMIAEQADLQNEANEIADAFAELDLVPENACEDVTLEALQAGAAFDNVEPTPAFSLRYEMPTNIYDLDELSNVIAEEEWRALGTVDAEINALKAKLIQLNDKRIGIVEECAHWRGKCERAIEIAEYEQNYDSNEADADLRQSIWLSTGQDIM